jgi:hypothetical protein
MPTLLVACHDVDVAALGRVHADADAGVGDDHVRQPLPLQTRLAGRHDAVGLRDISTIDFIAACAYPASASP